MKEQSVFGGFVHSIQFSKIYGFGVHSSHFSEFKLVGMLEACDYSSINQVLVFSGAIADLFCENVYSAKVTNVFTFFVDHF